MPRAAAAMLADGRYLWNAGIFLFRADDDAGGLCAPMRPIFLPPVQAALAAARADLGFLRLAAGALGAGAPTISIDYAVMEKAENLSVVPYDGALVRSGRLGRRLAREPADAAGVAAAGRGDGHRLRRQPAAVRQRGAGTGRHRADRHRRGRHARCGAGRRPDPRAGCEGGGRGAEGAEGAKQAETFPRDHRPWGWFETLALADRFQVKRIVVHPGAALSLQSHSPPVRALDRRVGHGAGDGR